jgi:hypothetical protein
MEDQLIAVIVRDFGGIGALILLLWRGVWPVIKEHLNQQRQALEQVAKLVEAMDRRLMVVEARCEVCRGIAPTDSNTE